MDKKKCLICCSEIDVQAKKCPFCKHWQNKISLVIWHPFFTVAILLVLYLLFQQFFIDTLGPGEDFAPVRSEIVLKDCTMEFGESKCGQTVVILGMIENNSDLNWEKPNFEIIFFDKDKNIIDTEQEENYSFVLPSKEKVPFKVSIRREFPQELYDSFEIRIVTAKEEGHY